MGRMDPLQNYWEVLRLVADTLKVMRGPVAIVAHENPDGDALGSSLGLARSLRALGKEAWWIMDPPHFLNFLYDDEELHAPIDRPPEDGAVIVLDVGDRARAEGAPVEGLVINIDHHGSNPGFGQLAVIAPERAATAEIIKDLVDLLGVPWSAQIAEPLLTGIITDTGNFRFANTTPETFRMAAELLSYGVNLAELTDRIALKPPAHYHLLAQVYPTITFHFDGLLVTASVTNEMLQSVGAKEEDAEGVVGSIRYAEGAVLAVFFKAFADRVKLSIRGRGRASALELAKSLGGGGHVPAAGATLTGVGLSEAYQLVLQAVEAELERAGYL